MNDTFSNGDRVRIISDEIDGKFEGKEGKIRLIEDGIAYVILETEHDGWTSVPFLLHELEPLEEESPGEQP